MLFRTTRRCLITVVYAQVKRLMLCVRRKIAVDAFATIANKNGRKQAVQKQIDQRTNKQADQLGKRRKDGSNGSNRAANLPVKVLLRVQIATTTNHAAL